MIQFIEGHAFFVSHTKCHYIGSYQQLVSPDVVHTETEEYQCV